jgi:hypothetical protein
MGRRRGFKILSWLQNVELPSKNLSMVKGGDSA